MQICKTYIAVLTSQFDDVSAVKTIYKKMIIKTMHLNSKLLLKMSKKTV